MHCTRCGHENPEGSRFCAQCGSALTPERIGESTSVIPKVGGDDTSDQLTPHEANIARLAREGRTNSEIGTELYISARTVEWHLRKVFTKLGISSRRELRTALPDARAAAVAA